MSHFEKPRWAIFNQRQHPLVHNLSDFFYANPALPGVSNIEDALNWAFKVLYPISKPAVATVGALPTLGNTINDYRVVTDDGDGNPAGYRWEKREGEAVESWHKVFDFDWSTDSIIAAYLDITQDLYVYKAGKSDLDGAGAVIVGTYAGQKVYGGNLANQNLTLAANSGDALGAPLEVLDISYTTENNNAGTNNVLNFTGQSFKPTQDGDISKVTLNLSRDNGSFLTPSGFVVVTIFDDNAGVPGALIATSDPISPTLFPGITFSEFDFIFSTPSALVSGDTYYLVIDVSGVSFDGFIKISIDSSGPTYADGSLFDSIDGGASWTAGPANDLYFKVYLNVPSGSSHSGYVQVDDNFRSTLDNTYDVGTASLKFKTGYFGTSVLAGSLTLSNGSIVDSSGAISFDNENLTTTGNITGAIGYYTSSIEVGPLVGDALILSAGSITDESGAISFSNENLTTTGTLASGTITVSSDLVLAVGSITSVSGTITFLNEDLTTTGTLSAGNTTVTRLDSDNIRLDGNTISILNTNGNLVLQSNGTGVIDLQNNATTLGITATGTVTITGQLNADNLRLDVNTISSTNLNGNITLTPNGAGIVETSAKFNPTTDNTLDLGDGSFRFNDLFMGGNISDGTTSVSQATLQSLRDINSGVALGFSLFYDGTKWVSSLPDTEITHNTLSGLTTSDAGHTQFVMLTGRASGQTIQGGTAASENLTLESTSHATKGFVFTKDTLKPFTDAVYSGGWTGTDLGGAANNFNDLYTKGEAKGLRLQNFTTAGLPSPSVQNVGRVVFDTDVNQIYVDTGTVLEPVGHNAFLSDTVWNGTDLTKDVTVSSTITDATRAIWQLCDNSNDFERIYTNIKTINATTVRITVNPALAAGSYRLIGFEA